MTAHPVPTDPELRLSHLFGRPEMTVANVIDDAATEVIRYGFGKAAFRDALETLDVDADENVLLPAYVPDGLVAPIRETGAEPRFYRIESDLGPVIGDVETRADQRTAAILAVDYFGFPAPRFEWVGDICDRYDAALVEDNAHAPISRQNGRVLGTRGDLGFTSFRKLLPVPDGAALYLDAERASGFEPSSFAGTSGFFTNDELRFLATSLLATTERRSTVVERLADAARKLRPSAGEAASESTDGVLDRWPNSTPDQTETGVDETADLGSRPTDSASAQTAGDARTPDTGLDPGSTVRDGDSSIGDFNGPNAAGHRPPPGRSSTTSSADVAESNPHTTSDQPDTRNEHPDLENGPAKGRDRSNHADSKGTIQSRDGRHSRVELSAVGEPVGRNPDAIYARSKQQCSRLSEYVIRRIDPTLVVERRRDVYRAWRNQFPYSVATPVYEDLPAGVCPQAFPIVAPNPEATKAVLSETGVPGVHTWPPLPDAVRESEQYDLANRLASTLLVIPVTPATDPTAIVRITADLRT